MVLVTPTKPKPAGRGILVNPLPASMPDNAILPAQDRLLAPQATHVRLQENIKPAVIPMEPKMGLA